MRSPFKKMYLRPGNLYKSFEVSRKKTVLENGHSLDKHIPYGDVTGILSEADAYQNDKMKHRWDQDQHSLTHTMVIRGRADLKKGDVLHREERFFYVLAADDPSYLGGSTIVYLEERKDVR